ncbi:MAG: alpha/beta fold hydrolase [Alphaproteobacteria bacterium]|nr:alpha/beta fold hydrolase [Alphaproteobacteria bacterium]
MALKMLISLVITVVVFFAIALGLIFSDRPEAADNGTNSGIDLGKAKDTDYSDLPPSRHFQARDGTPLTYRIYQSAIPTDRLIILVHGSAWHGMQFHHLAQALSARGLGTIVAPDMRGHGAAPVRRGDVDYIGQLEDDMADLIGHLKTEPKDRQIMPQIILGGHSSGGGFVVRFAGGDYGGEVDGFILLAPFLKYNAPTTRANAGGWARPATRRFAGLAMLNRVLITALNHLPVISFAMPRWVLDGPYGHTATTLYSYRMNAAFAPRANYESDLASITQPLLVIAGAADESFFAHMYEVVISEQTATGRYHILPSVNHMGVVDDPATLSIIDDWLTSAVGPRDP